jgi:hypothetical protein
MWGTFILDAYLNWERQRVAEALEELCSSRDDYGFASGGVYCFWALDTRRPLYIGRAVDLPERFRQHNGLGSTRTKGTKLANINEFFGDTTDEKPLGFSILVRSPLSQTETGRRKRDLRKLEGWVEDPESIDSEIEYEIAEAEAVAIRSSWLEYGDLPPWNQIQGQRTPWGMAMKRPDHTAEMFCGMRDSLLQARESLVRHARDPTWLAYEMDLHVARIEAAKRGVLANRQISDLDVLEMLDWIPDWWGLRNIDRIRSDKYLLGGAWVMGAPPDPASLALRAAWTAGEALPEVRSDHAPPLRPDDERSP